MAVNVDDYESRVRSGGGGSAPTLGAGEPLVWTGYESSTGGSRPASDRPGFSSSSRDMLPGIVKPPASISTASGRPSSNTEPDRVDTVSGVQRKWYDMTDAERKRWGAHLLALGFVTESQSRDFYTLQKWWEQFVVDAAAMYNNGAGRRVDPWQAARLIAGDQEDINSRIAAGRQAAPFTGTKSQTSTSIDLTDATTARVLLNDVLAQALGRDARQDEISAFLSVLNEAERKNPSTTVSSVTYKDGDAVSQSSTTSGGMTNAGRQQVLLDQAREMPEYGAYQAATTYYNSLLQAIRSPV